MRASPTAEQTVSSPETDLKIISRSKAKALGLKTYFTGRPCKHGHVAPRVVSAKQCRTCAYLSHDKWVEKNPNAHKERTAIWRAANLEKARQNSREWPKKNREAYRDCHIRRSRRFRQATPPWVDLEVIVQIYKKCRRITRETGIKHHVDHIHPLHGKNFCGLHVPWNLEILQALDNLSKGNRLLDPSLASS